MILFDYFSFTILEDDVNYLSIAHYLKIDPSLFVELKGVNGYQVRYCCHGVNICTNGQVGMGVHVFITGEGCRYLESLKDFTWKKLFSYVYMYKSNVCRLDVARDCFNYELDLDKIEELMLNGNCVSVFTKASIRTEIERLKTGETGGKTLYFGRRESNVFIRMYDKKQEQNVNCNYWVRCELELKRIVADQFIVCYLSSMDIEPIGELFTSLLNRYIRFANGTDTNRSRWKTLDFWVKFIDTTKKLYLSLKKVQKSFEHLRKHFVKQYGRFLTMMVLADDDDTVLNNIAENMLHKLKPRQIDIINDYRKSMGNVELSI